MAKMIKFDLSIGGSKVKTFEELQDNLHVGLLPYLKTGRLVKWFLSRDMADKAEMTQAIDVNQSDLALMVALCEVLELEADEDILEELLAQAVVVEAKLTETPTASVQVEESQQDVILEENNTLPTRKSHIDYSGKNLSGHNFDDQDLSHANFEGANLAYTSFKNVNLTGANLSNAILDNASFSMANLTYANLSNTRLNGTVFRGAILESSNLSNATAEFVEFDYANLTNANLRRSNITYAGVNCSSFYHADLTNTNFSEAIFNSVSFKESIMVNTNFSFANFVFCIFSSPNEIKSGAHGAYQNVNLNGVIGFSGLKTPFRRSTSLREKWEERGKIHESSKPITRSSFKRF